MNFFIARYKGEEIPSNKNSAGVLVQSINHATGENSWKVRNRVLFWKSDGERVFVLRNIILEAKPFPLHLPNPFNPGHA